MQRLRIEFNFDTEDMTIAESDELTMYCNMAYRAAKEILQQHKRVSDVTSHMMNITPTTDD